MKAIETKNLSRRFGDRIAVDSLDMSVDEGELFALLGVNGAGKTTTIRMLTGLLPPSGGEAWLLGRSILTDSMQARQLTAVSPQESAVAPKLTVRENLELMAGVYGADRAAARAAAEELLRDFGLGEVEKQRAKSLSGGWQRRLSIAMALVTKPQILFLDEPTLGLDVLARRELWKHVQALKGRVTVVLTTHYMEEAEALADRIGIMSTGRLKAVGTAAALKAQTKTDNIEDAFVALAGEGRELL